MSIAILLALATVSLVVSALEVLALRRHLRRGPRLFPKHFRPRVSVLKPLCGRDASLAENLASFLEQDAVEYELILGVRDRSDPAWPLAVELAERFPERVRAVVQRGEVGANPKVNQLATLAEEARGEILVISDSNVRVPRGYLADLVAPLGDHEVGMVTSPIAGMSGRRLGGRIDALHLMTFVTPSVAGSKFVAGQDLFIGKSMAFRRADLERLGGFRRFARVLAEDHALGRAMLALGKRAELGRVPVVNVTDATLKQCFDRYARWGLMQRWIAGPGYPAQLLTFPLLLAAAAALAGAGHVLAVELAALLALAKLALDDLSIRGLTGAPPTSGQLALEPVRELVAFAAFMKAFTSNGVDWRGNRFVVAAGTRLVSPEAHARWRRLRHA